MYRMDAHTGLVNAGSGPDEREGQCRRCQLPFRYVWAGRPRTFCPACKRLNMHDASAQSRERLKLKEGELAASREGPLLSLTIHTERQVADMLGVSQQRVQQITREALVSLRKLLLEPVRVWREPLPELEFTFREMEEELRDWKNSLTILRARLNDGELGGDDELRELVAEMEREVSEFEVALQAGVDGQKKKRQTSTDNL